MRRLSLVPLVLLAACGTPQEQCINRNTRDLRVMEKLIAETQGNLSRGYAIEEYTVHVPVWQLCQAPAPAPGQPAAAPYYCFEQEAQTRSRPKAIDLKAESAKLESMLERRDQLARAAEPVIAQCKAQYPD
ncbi:hypothetical protein [Fuscovulum ytuae]|uniref:Lipoprotein n=1 Tax=Fuscovulum ytuae TaxID=3042299 RepID=A0ABY8Q5G6_9RHOB|nr:hypothetical protein [Fuscovulum sp. YMD61]WGV15580.1 hypothetical protein QF092_15140 [Fuscovulum sp. YMD61]